MVCLEKICLEKLSGGQGCNADSTAMKNPYPFFLLSDPLSSPSNNQNWIVEACWEFSMVLSIGPVRGANELQKKKARAWKFNGIAI